MLHADKRPFRAAELSDAALKILTTSIGTAGLAGPLELCKMLREIADSGELAFQHDHEVEHLRLSVAASVLADLCEQEWLVESDQGEITVRPPDWTDASGHDAEQIKTRMRNGLQIASDRQIATASVQDFVRSMERNRVFNERVVSISTIVDNGRDLSDRLRALTKLDRNAREQRLVRMFDPYLVVCDEGTACQFTGINLLDVWRYFRHTWSLEYNPLPGRTLRFLVRNRARPNHPVIGIAMLASPAANLYMRDSWIGWRLEDIVSGLASNTLDPEKVARVLFATIKEAISDIRSDDLLSAKEQKLPTEETFFKLRQIAGLAYRRRREDLIERSDGDGLAAGRIVDIRTFEKKSLGGADWKNLSETSLYVKKRAEQLIPLLRAYAYLKQAEFDTVPAAALYETIVSKHGREILSYCLNELRKRKLATEVADLAVCGAIAPYNHLLGGKLVTLLMSSKDVRKMYADRYKTQESEIASQMAGRPIVRSSDLHVVTTTSLYGVSSSQYNRLKLDIADRGKIQRVEWKYLGKSKGLTITHVTRRTVALMRKLGRGTHGTHRINSVFGEGSSPRTRQIREGLNLIGINNDDVLMQTVGRRVYACELFPGANGELTGFNKPEKGPKGVSAASIGRAWINRWLVDRVLNTDVLDRIRASEAKAISEAFKARALRGKLDMTEEGGDEDGLLAVVSDAG